MESRKETASAKKASGAYNCTQAVCCTYHDFTGLDEETIKHAGNSFAVGMGNMEGTCGALIGAGIVYGLFTKDKAKSARGMRQIMEIAGQPGAHLPLKHHRRKRHRQHAKQRDPPAPEDGGDQQQTQCQTFQQRKGRNAEPHALSASTRATSFSIPVAA